MNLKIDTDLIFLKMIIIYLMKNDILQKIILAKP